jgi:hypothetical protein
LLFCRLFAFVPGADCNTFAGTPDYPIIPCYRCRDQAGLQRAQAKKWLHK